MGFWTLRKVFAASALLISAISPVTGYNGDDSKGDPARFKYYNMPTGWSGPCDLTTGFDGGIWVSDLLVNKIARIDPRSGKIEEYNIPYKTVANGSIPFPPPIPFPDGSTRTALACVAQPGEDGNVYFATGLRNQLVRMNPRTREIKVFTPPAFNPAGDLLFLNDMFRYKDAMYFTMTSAGKLVRFDYKTEQFKIYTVPGTGQLFPVGVFWASDDKIWVAGFGANRIYRFDPETEKFTSTPLPPNGIGPGVIRADSEDANGRYIWYAGFLSNSIGRVNMDTLKVDAYTSDSPASFPLEDVNDNKGRIWYSTGTQNALNFIDSKTLKFTHIPTPGTPIVAPISAPPALDVASHYDNNTNSIWFTEVLNNRVGKYQLDP